MSAKQKQIITATKGGGRQTEVHTPNCSQRAPNPFPVDAFLNESPPPSGSGSQESISTALVSQRKQQKIVENDEIFDEKDDELPLSSQMRQHKGNSPESRAEVHDWLMENDLEYLEGVLFKRGFTSMRAVRGIITTVQVTGGTAMLNDMGLDLGDQSVLVDAIKQLCDCQEEHAMASHVVQMQPVSSTVDLEEIATIAGRAAGEAVAKMEKAEEKEKRSGCLAILLTSWCLLCILLGVEVAKRYHLQSTAIVGGIGIGLGTYTVSVFIFELLWNF